MSFKHFLYSDTLTDVSSCSDSEFMKGRSSPPAQYEELDDSAIDTFDDFKLPELSVSHLFHILCILW